MSELKVQIQGDMKAAMKAKEAERLSVIRMVWAAVRKKEIDSQEDASDADIIGIVQKEIKSKEETIGFLKQGNRQEDIDANMRQIEFLKAYLPTQLDEDELRSIVLKTKEELGAEGPKDMGKMMGKLSAQLKGQCDGKLLSQIVRESLNG